MTSGTAVFGLGFGPVDTFTRTRAPASSEVPGAGNCETTLFAGWLELT